MDSIATVAREYQLASHATRRASARESVIRALIALTIWIVLPLQACTNSKESLGPPVLPPDDTQKPNVRWTAPTAGESLTGDVTLRVEASDDQAVVGVRIRADGLDLGEVMSAPYVFIWRSSGDGPSTLWAIARDAAGNRDSASLGVLRLSPAAVELANELRSVYAAPPDVNRAEEALRAVTRAFEDAPTAEAGLRTYDAAVTSALRDVSKENLRLVQSAFNEAIRRMPDPDSSLSALREARLSSVHDEPNSQVSQIQMMYLNGILTEPGEQWATYLALRRLVEPAPPNGLGWTPPHYYFSLPLDNPSEGLFLDLAESRENINSGDGRIPELIRDPPTAISRVVAAQINRVTDTLRRSAILVAHSQGNLIIREALARGLITRPECLGIVSLATPIYSGWPQQQFTTVRGVTAANVATAQVAARTVYPASDIILRWALFYDPVLPLPTGFELISTPLTQYSRALWASLGGIGNLLDRLGVEEEIHSIRQHYLFYAPEVIRSKLEEVRNAVPQTCGVLTSTPSRVNLDPGEITTVNVSYSGPPGIVRVVDSARVTNGFAGIVTRDGNAVVVRGERSGGEDTIRVWSGPVALRIPVRVRPSLVVEPNEVRLAYSGCSGWDPSATELRVRAEPAQPFWVTYLDGSVNPTGPGRFSPRANPGYRTTLSAAFSAAPKSPFGLPDVPLAIGAALLPDDRVEVSGAGQVGLVADRSEIPIPFVDASYALHPLRVYGWAAGSSANASTLEPLAGSPDTVSIGLELREMSGSIGISGLTDSALVSTAVGHIWRRVVHLEVDSAGNGSAPRTLTLATFDERVVCVEPPTVTYVQDIGEPVAQFTEEEIASLVQITVAPGEAPRWFNSSRGPDYDHAVLPLPFTITVRPSASEGLVRPPRGRLFAISYRMRVHQDLELLGNLARSFPKTLTSYPGGVTVYSTIGFTVYVRYR